MSHCGCTDQQYIGCVPAAKCLSCPVVVSMTRPKLEPGQQWFNPVTGILLLQGVNGLIPISPAPGSGLRVNELGNLEVIAGRGVEVNLNTNAIEAALGAGLGFDSAGRIAVQSASSSGTAPPSNPAAGQAWNNTGAFDSVTGIPAGGIATWDGSKWVLTGGSTTPGGGFDRFMWAQKAAGGTLPISSSFDFLSFGSDTADGSINGVTSWPASGLEIKASGLYSIVATLTCGLPTPTQVGLFIDQNDQGASTGYLGRSASNGTFAAAVEVSFTGFLKKNDNIKIRSNRISLNNTTATASIVQYSAGITRIS